MLSPSTTTKVKPFAQPDPVTISEKSAVKFKPQLNILSGCVPFPAVNAAGETSGGLKGSGGTDDCKLAPLGSQIYGRATWHNDIWAITYACTGNPKSYVSTSNTDYDKIAPASFANASNLVLQRYSVGLSSDALRFIMEKTRGDAQDLIMWEQLTDAARTALSDQENFGRADVPISDANFPKWLENAWPF
ncbi:unnamed protein product [Phytophthora lilii]|uniref:Unnamed protein product n=1 Tax=Phytophthora lilii TaxID=2077276 RepID=A0A9W7CN31_9STRA|nr:unnamed protein product [Phytophthora lilii]